MTRKNISIAVLFGLLAALALALPVFAQEPLPTPSADEVNAIAKNMYCPVCENIPLDVCGTAACAQWRQQIADLLVEGYSEEEIYDYFVAQYGDRVLATPPATGLNWLIYIVPPVLIAGGIIFLARYFQNVRKPSKAGAIAETEKPEIEDEYLARIEEELKNRR